MASGGPGERLCEEARCPVCLDFLQKPVSVDCGHSFCLRCISEFCEKSDSAQSGLYACPQCRGPFRLESFRPNRQLASLVDSVRQLGLGAGPSGARLCVRHGEELSRFCEEDQEALCWVCDTTPEHRSHRTTPLQEAARCYQVRGVTTARGGPRFLGLEMLICNRGADWVRGVKSALLGTEPNATTWSEWPVPSAPTTLLAHIHLEVSMPLLRAHPTFRDPCSGAQTYHYFRLPSSPMKFSLDI